MNRAEHLMTIAAEEAMEVGHRITKAMRFGMTEVQPEQPFTNAERIVEEFHDLFAVLAMMLVEGAMPMGESLIPSADQLLAKREKVNSFFRLSAAQGTLSGDNRGDA